MAAEKVKASTTLEGGATAEVEFEYDFGANLQEAIALYGEAEVFDCYKGKAEIKVQGAARGKLQSNWKPEDIVVFMKTYKLGQTTRVALDPIAASMAKFATMSPAEQEAYIAQLKQMAGAA